VSVAEDALDRAAELIAAAVGAAVQRDPVAAVDDEADAVSGTGLVIALSEGATTETGYCIGASRPYEFEHAAAFQVLVVRGDETARRARRREVVADSEAAIAADPTLGGLVDHAEFASPDPSDEELYAGLAASLVLTYTAPTALG
jgi:hypothetical protein